MAQGAKSSNTAVTEQDKITNARRKDAEANVKSASDDPAVATAATASRLPSDVEAFARYHGLTNLEAELVMDDTDNGRASNTADRVAAAVAARTVNRPVYVEQPAGISHPLQQAEVVVPPTPPAPEVLDPTQPGPQDPTAHVVREGGDHRAEEVQDAAADYVDAADAATEKVDEAGVAEHEDSTQIATE